MKLASSVTAGISDGFLSKLEDLATPTVLVPTISIAMTLIPTALILSNQQIQKSPWLARFLWVAAFLINVITVSIPGRFDGSQVDSKNGKATYPWETLFAPAGYAFAIWAVIYIGELLVTLHTAAFGNPVSPLRRAAPFFVAGNLFQSLWCGAFRPVLRNYLWLPSLLLACAAFSMFNAHIELTLAMREFGESWTGQVIWPKLGLALLRFPIALHTGWLCAATLLNVNGWAAVSHISTGRQIALAFGSSYGAALLGAWLSYASEDPFLALTVAWAMRALAVNHYDEKKQQRKTGKLVIAPETTEALSVTQGALAVFLCVASIL
jgi:hypothetical protein